MALARVLLALLLLLTPGHVCVVRASKSSPRYTLLAGVQGAGHGIITRSAPLPTGLNLASYPHTSVPRGLFAIVAAVLATARPRGRGRSMSGGVRAWL